MFMTTRLRGQGIAEENWLKQSVTRLCINLSYMYMIRWR